MAISTLLAPVVARNSGPYRKLLAQKLTGAEAPIGRSWGNTQQGVRVRVGLKSVPEFGVHGFQCFSSMEMSKGGVLSTAGDTGIGCQPLPTLLPSLPCQWPDTLLKSRTCPVCAQPGPDPLDPSQSLEASGEEGGFQNCSWAAAHPPSTPKHSRAPVPEPCLSYQLHSNSLGLSAEPVFLAVHSSKFVY